MKPSLSIAALLTFALPAWSARAHAPPPPDPEQDSLLIAAGYLENHQDLKYRRHGMDAYRQGRYEDAMRLFRRAGFFADKPSQAMIAEMYWKGEGVARDPVQAYIWMDLAAERGYRGFLLLRERYWRGLDEDQRARVAGEGQAIYARFGDAAAKPRYAHQLRIGRSQMTGSRTGFNRGVKILIPDLGLVIDGSKYYDERYWDPKKYWAWQDRLWMTPRIGKVTVGEIEAADAASRIPETRPDIDAEAPDVQGAEPAPRTP